MYKIRVCTGVWIAFWQVILFLFGTNPIEISIHEDHCKRALS